MNMETATHPATHSPAGQNSTLRRFISFSLFLHLALFAFLFLKSIVFPSEPKEYLPSLRVDLVALPDRKASEPVEIKPVEQAPEAAPPAPAKKETVVKVPAKEHGDFSVSKKKKNNKPSKREVEAQNRLKNAIARMKALERIKAMSGEPVKGNQISKGSAVTGSAKVALETTYTDVVVERVRANWELPQWLKEQNLSAKVKLFINRQGTLVRYEFTKTSGNDQFDSEVKRTLQASSPFPIPPGAILGEVSSDGITLGFPI